MYSTGTEGEGNETSALLSLLPHTVGDIVRIVDLFVELEGTWELSYIAATVFITHTSAVVQVRYWVSGKRDTYHVGLWLLQ